MANVFYNRIIRKLVVGFGNIFNDITLVRYNPDLSEAERMLVPIVYADKENYVRRLSEDYNLDKKVQITLPRMSFEMTGLSYDVSRKHNTNTKNFAQTSSGVVAQYNPVPYNFDFNLYIYVRNIEDGTQIIEHILSYFTPDYTIKINMIPEMGVIKEVPIILNSTTQEVNFEGNRDAETRTVVWTLNFTVKGHIFGKVSTTNVIKASITNILNHITPEDIAVFNMTLPGGVGTYQVGEVVYQGFSVNTATATAKVVEFNNSKLHLTNISGNFVTGQPVYGVVTNTNYTFSSYNLAGKIPRKLVEIDIEPNPPTANANDDYGYTTTITEENFDSIVSIGANNVIINSPAETLYDPTIDIDLMQ